MLFFLSLLSLSSCGSDPIVVSGTATFDWIPAESVAEGGNKLDYTAEVQKPIRRAIVQAISASSGEVLSESATNDNGGFSVSGTDDLGIYVRILAKISGVTAADGISPDNCQGGVVSAIKVIDNTSSGALYGLQTSTQFTESASGALINAPLTYSGGYSLRSAAPFAILDTIVSEMELVCQGNASVSFPALNVNWSINNTNTSGSISLGQIGTSFYSSQNLFILGKENVDTDEFDDHVIAHEFGHYLEDQIYRSDSIGGAHSTSQSLDARVAFGEGFGNAVAAMTFNDPIYVDTFGSSQASGFEIQVDTAPTGDDRGIYSETASQYFLWNLYENRDGTANSGSFDRLHNILANFQKTTSALTTLQSFASFYNQEYGGSAESLSTLWGTDLDLDFNSLCSGACSGSGDTADPFDLDGDNANRICNGCASPRKYPQGSGSNFTATFWNLYKTISSGTSASDDHQQTNFGGYSSEQNKYGSVRWYRYVAGSTTTVTVSVSNITGSTCTTDVLDLYIYSSGSLVSWDVSSSGSTAGCPSASFSATSGQTYIFTVNGFTTELSAFDVTVSP